MNSIHSLYALCQVSADPGLLRISKRRFGAASNML